MNVSIEDVVAAAVARPVSDSWLHISGDGPNWEWPDTGEVCCMGSAEYGPGRCTCWEPVYDLAQAPLVDEADARFGVCGQMCVDCAYRPDSPERQGSEHVVGDESFLMRIVVSGHPFACHQGIRRPLRYVHEPTGTVFTPTAEQIDAAYRPPIRKGWPYKADGTPADLCAGWAQRRLLHLQRVRDVDELAAAAAECAEDGEDLVVNPQEYRLLVALGEGEWDRAVAVRLRPHLHGTEVRVVLG